MELTWCKLMCLVSRRRAAVTPLHPSFSLRIRLLLVPINSMWRPHYFRSLKRVCASKAFTTWMVLVQAHYPMNILTQPPLYIKDQCLEERDMEQHTDGLRGPRRQGSSLAKPRLISLETGRPKVPQRRRFNFMHSGFGPTQSRFAVTLPKSVAYQRVQRASVPRQHRECDVSITL